jgi:hypothetical protein
MITIPASKLDTSIFMGNAQLQAIHYRGFHPSRCGFPDSITPEQEHIIIAKHRGSMKGQALSPPSSYQHLEFHINGKGILQSHKFYNGYQIIDLNFNQIFFISIFIRS